jgi:hypothetical protein
MESSTSDNQLTIHILNNLKLDDNLQLALMEKLTKDKDQR